MPICPISSEAKQDRQPMAALPVSATSLMAVNVMNGLILGGSAKWVIR
jgi:hypothetical protein